MARSVIPDFGIEYPPYEYREWPKQVGLDENGDQLVAKDQEEYDRLLPDVYFPKIMGKDKGGKDVIAYIPRDLDWKKSLVAVPPEDPAIAKKREQDRLDAEAEIKRKAEAYDALMAKNALADQKATGAADNALTGAKKTKAA